MKLAITVLSSFLVLFLHVANGGVDAKSCPCRATNAPATQVLSDDDIISEIDNLPNSGSDPFCVSTERCAAVWISQYNKIWRDIQEKASILDYEYETNITDQTEEASDDFDSIANRFLIKSLKNAKNFYSGHNFTDKNLERMLKLAKSGTFMTSDEDEKKLAKISSQLNNIYATATVYDPETKQELELEPGLTAIISNSSSGYDRLLFAWTGWYNASGAQMKDLFPQSVDLNNEAATDSGYDDLSEYWLEDYEEGTDFEDKMGTLLEEIRPLYEQIHAYVRRKLNDKYGDKYDKNYHNPQLIPAHLLGDMWAQTWDNMYDILAPYPGVPQFDLTSLLIKNNYTEEGIFREAERFYVSIGLEPMTPSFWQYSMILRPPDRDVVCHASSSDFYNSFDWRIKMCTVVNQEYFETVHHEMGHTEYFMAYRDQPTIFRNGANSGFHEAIGDTIALSAMTPTHYKNIGFIDDDSLSEEQTINFLFLNALKKVVFLPFGYLIDKWRWEVFRGHITPENYNKKWWEMVTNNQGLERPVEAPENAFDPGAKYHVAAYVPYSRYFAAFMYEFQFFRALCEESGHTGDLFKCDFYNSKKAGLKFKNMLTLGASKFWREPLKELTGDDDISSKAILDYFDPLYKWLQTENAKYPKDTVGWDKVGDEATKNKA